MWTGMVMVGVTGAAMMPSPAAAADGWVSIEEAVGHAVTLCARAVQTEGAVRFDRPAGAQLYHDQLAMAGKTNVARKLAEAPALIQRFVQTLPWRAIEPPSMMMRYVASSGEAWAVLGGRTRSCNVAVTGSVDPAAALLIDGMTSAGWRNLVARPATKPGMLAQHILVKMNPTPSAPNWGVRALVRSLGFTPDTRDGIQMEMAFVAGDIVIKGSPAPLPQGTPPPR